MNGNMSALYKLLFKLIFLPVFDSAKGLKFGKYLSELEKSQWWSTSDLLAMQDEKLHKLIEHAYQNVPYYREVMDQNKLRPNDIRKSDDLQKLPILTREIVRLRAEDLRARDNHFRKSRIKSTGGTTGEPLQYLIDWDSWSHITACRYRGQSFAGYYPGEKIITFAGSSLIPNSYASIIERLRWKMERNTPLSAVKLTPEIMAEYGKKINRIKPKYIIGYPTALYVFADYLINHNLIINGLKGIFSTAETLQTNHRELIEKAFNCSVFNAYGCGDGGIVATECKEHRGLHIAMEHSIIEILGGDGLPVKNDDGNIIATDLHNFAQPFIRYEVGDIGKFSNEPCTCGRGLSLLESVEGRKTDVLHFDNGVILSGPAITLMFRDTKILQYQLVQNNGHSLTVNIRKAVNTSDEDIRFVEHLLTSHLGSGVEVIIKIVDDIPPTKSWKRRFIVSNLN